MGLSYNNSRKIIDVQTTGEKIDYVQALPGIYMHSPAFTAAFFKKGKKRPIEMMSKAAQLVNVFSKRVS